MILKLHYCYKLQPTVCSAQDYLPGSSTCILNFTVNIFKDGQFSETKQAKVHKALNEMTEMLGGCIEFFDDTTQQKYAELGF